MLLKIGFRRFAMTFTNERKPRIEKLRIDAEDCILISKLATSPTKREEFRKLADEYQSMARELKERIFRRAEVAPERVFQPWGSESSQID